jgi:molybdopterin converting factor small subunit
MKIEIIAYGIAKDIIDGPSLSMDVVEAVDVGTVRKILLSAYPALKGLASLQLAVNAEYVKDDFVLKENDEVVIIPPVSGG